MQGLHIGIYASVMGKDPWYPDRLYEPVRVPEIPRKKTRPTRFSDQFPDHDFNHVQLFVTRRYLVLSTSESVF